MSDRIQEAIKDLRADLACVDMAIHSLEIMSGQKSRRGRPLKIMNGLGNGRSTPASSKARKRPRSKR